MEAPFPIEARRSVLGQTGCLRKGVVAIGICGIKLCRARNEPRQGWPTGRLRVAPRETYVGIRVVLFRLARVVLRLDPFTEALPLDLSAVGGFGLSLGSVSGPERRVECSGPQLGPELTQRLSGCFPQLQAQVVPGIRSVCHRVLGSVARGLGLLAGPVLGRP